MLNKVKILPLVTPLSEQYSTTVAEHLLMAQAHKKDLVKDGTPRIERLLVFLSQIYVRLSAVRDH